MDTKADKKTIRSNWKEVLNLSYEVAMQSPNRLNSDVVEDMLEISVLSGIISNFTIQKDMMRLYDTLGLNVVVVKMVETDVQGFYELHVSIDKVE